MRLINIIIVVSLVFVLCTSLYGIGLYNINVKIISQNQIQQSGMMRLSDLFLILDDWDVSTVDGITYNASPIGLNSHQHQDWKVYLNGNPIDIDFFGIKTLDRIPVDISQIDAIRIENHAGVYNGQKTTGGIIDIYTKKPKSDLSIKFRTGFGNETGDPGPYSFTDKSTPNIDKVGNIIASGISYGKTDSYFNFGYKREIAYPTDEAIFWRTNSIAGSYYPRQKLEAYFGDYKKTYDKFGYTLFGGISEFDDFFFLRQFGREIPTNSKLHYINSSGYIGDKSRPAILYRFAYSKNQLNKRANSLNIDYDWQEENVRASIETNLKIPRSNTTVGIGLNHRAVQTGYILDKNKFDEFILYGQSNFALSKSIVSSIDISFNFQNEDVGYLFSSNAVIPFWLDGKIVPSLSYSKTLPEETNSIWYWQQSGYGFLEDNGVSYDIKGNLKPSKKLTADLTLIKQFSRRLYSELTGYYRSFSDIYCEGQFLISQSDFSAPNNLVVDTDITGQIAGAKIKMAYVPNNKLQVELYGRFQDHIADNSLFSENWQNLPKTTFSGRIYYTPINNFSLWSRIKYIGATRWVDYENTDNVDSKFHNSVVVDNIFTVDITAQKYFHQRKIRTSFSIRNLFNRELRYIPIGAKFDLSYFAQIEFLLN